MAKTSRFGGGSGSVRAEDDRRDEGRPPGFGRPAVRRPSASMSTSWPAGSPSLLAVGREVGLVDPDPYDGAPLDDGLAGLAEQLAARRVEAVLRQPVGPVQAWLQQRGDQVGRQAPSSRVSSTVVSYVQGCGTPGNVQR